MIIAIIVTFIVTVAVMLFLYSMLLKRIDSEYTEVIKMCWEQLEIPAKKEKLSVAKFIEKQNDQDYAIYFLGKIFMLMNKNVGEKKGQELKYQDIVNKCNDYLQVALKKDIKEYKEKQTSQSEMIRQDIKNLNKGGK